MGDQTGSHNGSGRRAYHTLDIMRAVAAIMVVMAHSARLGIPNHAPSDYLAVDFFFALSGFVVAHAYDDRLARGEAGAFAWIRFVRLAPLYYLGLGFGVIAGLVSLAGAPFSTAATAGLAAATVLNAVLAPAPPYGIFAPAEGHYATNNLMFPVNSPAWSLLFEAISNAAYALFFRWLTTRLLAIVMALGAFGLVFAAYRQGSLIGGVRWSDGWVGLVRVAYAFCAGVLIARRGVVMRIPGGVATPILLMIALFTFNPGSWRATYDLVIVLLCPILVAVGCAVEPPARLFPTAKYLGIISYTIYVLHVPILNLMRSAKPALGWSNAGVAVASYVAIALVVVTADRYFDRPVRRALAPRKARVPGAA